MILLRDLIRNYLKKYFSDECIPSKVSRFLFNCLNSRFLFNCLNEYLSKEVSCLLHFFTLFPVCRYTIIFLVDLALIRKYNHDVKALIVIEMNDHNTGNPVTQFTHLAMHCVQVPFVSQLSNHNTGQSCYFTRVATMSRER